MATYLTKLMRSIDADHLRRAFFGALREEILTATRLTPRRPIGGAVSAMTFMGIGAATALGVVAFVPAARRVFLDTSEQANGKLRAAVSSGAKGAAPKRQLGRSSASSKSSAGRNGRMRRASAHA
jgi:hypothetical protein